MNRVLVTGAARGLGRELIRVFIENNWRALALVRTTKDAASLKREFPIGLIPLIGDVASPKTSIVIRNALEQEKGPLKVLVNNAGIPGDKSRLAEVEADELTRLFNVHCLGAFSCTKAAQPFLRQAGQALVVNLSSRFGSLALNSSGKLAHLDVSYSYRISKAAQNMLTVCLNQELQGQGIMVAALHPGRIGTSMAVGELDLPPDKAAEKLFEWIQNAGKKDAGGYFDLITGDRLDW